MSKQTPQPHPCDIRAVANVGVVGPWEEPLLIVLDLYWKMSCSLDSLSCPAWSDCLCCLGDRGEKSEVVGDTGVAGKWFDSSSVRAPISVITATTNRLVLTR